MLNLGSVIRGGCPDFRLPKPPQGKGFQRLDCNYNVPSLIRMSPKKLSNSHNHNLLVFCLADRADRADRASEPCTGSEGLNHLLTYSQTLLVNLKAIPTPSHRNIPTLPHKSTKTSRHPQFSSQKHATATVTFAFHLPVSASTTIYVGYNPHITHT